ncbi:MAG: ribosome assembly factor SBDS [Sulfolobales archaeon]
MSREYIIVRFEKDGKRFEILADPDKVLEYREGKKIPLSEVVYGDFIYKDARKGLKASPSDIEKVFGTQDTSKVMHEILVKGEIQLTTEQRRKMIEAKRKMIITYIARNSIDPVTKKPVPPARIEAAMEQARVSIDINKGVEEQAIEIVKAISKIIPIKMAIALLRIRIPGDYASKVHQTITRLGEVRRSQWLSDGGLEVEIAIPAGLQGDVIDRVSKLTHGSAQISVVEVR